MIIDCFCFYNELELLEVRFDELDSIVDKFVLVESIKTQSLLPKPLYFENNKNRFSKYLDKVVHVIIEDCPDNSSDLWQMEHYQRTEGYKRGLSRINIGDKDIIHASDLDEIPRAKTIQSIIELGILDTLYTCTLDLNFYAYFINLMAAHRTWAGGSLTLAKAFLQKDPHFFTDNRESLFKIKNAGWHLSWLGGPEKVYEKAFACIEPSDKSKIPPKDQYIQYFYEHFKKEKKTFIHIENLDQNGIEFIQTPIDNTYPKFIINNLDKFNQFIL